MNYLPVRPLIKYSSGDGAWVIAQRAEQRKQFKAIICALKCQNDDKTNKKLSSQIVTEYKSNMFCKDLILDSCKTVDPNKVAVVNVDLYQLQPSEEIFTEFSSIYKIQAAGNYLNFDCFRTFTCLTELYLSSNGLTNVRINPRDFQNLEILDLSFNELTMDDVLTLGLIRNLRKLSLCGNSLNQLPKQMNEPFMDEEGHYWSRFSELMELDLEKNNLSLEETFSSLGGLRKLKILKLAYNRISSIPLLRCIHVESGKSSENLYQLYPYGNCSEYEEELDIPDMYIQNTKQMMKIPSTLLEVDEEGKSVISSRFSSRKDDDIKIVVLGENTEVEDILEDKEDDADENESLTDIEGNLLKQKENIDVIVENKNVSINKVIDMYRLESGREVFEGEVEGDDNINNKNEDIELDKLESGRKLQKGEASVEEMKLKDYKEMNEEISGVNSKEEIDSNQLELKRDVLEEDDRGYKEEHTIVNDNEDIYQDKLEPGDSLDQVTLHDENTVVEEVEVKEEHTNGDIYEDKLEPEDSLDQVTLHDENMVVEEVDVKVEHTNEDIYQDKLEPEDSLDQVTVHDDNMVVEDVDIKLEHTIDIVNEKNNQPEGSLDQLTVYDEDILVEEVNAKEEHTNEDINEDKFEPVDSINQGTLHCDGIDTQEIKSKDEKETMEIEEHIVHAGLDSAGDIDNINLEDLKLESSVMNNSANDDDKEEEIEQIEVMKNELIEDIIVNRQGTEEKVDNNEVYNVNTTRSNETMHSQRSTIDDEDLGDYNVLIDDFSMDIGKRGLHKMRRRSNYIVEINRDLTTYTVTEAIKMIAMDGHNPDTFRPFPVLEILDLSHNKIKEEKGIIPAISWINLRQLSIYENPLTLSKSQKSSFIKELLENAFKITVNWLPPIKKEKLHTLASKSKIDVSDTIPNFPQKLFKIPSPLPERNSSEEEIKRSLPKLMHVSDIINDVRNHDEKFSLQKYQLPIFPKQKSLSDLEQDLIQDPDVEIMHRSKTHLLSALKHHLEHPITFFDRRVDLFQKQQQMVVHNKIDRNSHIVKDAKDDSIEFILQQQNFRKVQTEMSLEKILSPDYYRGNRTREKEFKVASKALNQIQRKYNQIRQQSLKREL